MCRGCCCGTRRKLPLQDHEADLQRLSDVLDGRARLRTSDCLGPCEDANVVVVLPSAFGRRQGLRPKWFRRVNDEDGWADVVHAVDVERR